MGRRNRSAGKRPKSRRNPKTRPDRNAVPRLPSMKKDPFVPRTQEEIESFKKGLVYAGLRTKDGRLVFYDPISRNMYQHEGRGVRHVHEGVPLEPCEVPFEVTEDRRAG